MPTVPAGPYARSALVYYDRGWSGVLPMPVGALAKNYPPKGFTGKDGIYPPRDQVARWAITRSTSNVAIRVPPGVVGIDVDAYEGKDGLATLTALARELGEWRAPDSLDTPVVRSSSRNDSVSGVYLFRASLPEGRRWRGELGPGIEVVHAGHRYVMAAPSQHPRTDASYRWLDARSNTVPLPAPDDLPELSDAWIEAATKPIHEAGTGLVPVDTGPKFTDGQDGTRYGLASLDRELAKLRESWDDDTGFNNQLNLTAFAAGQLVAGGELADAYAQIAINDLMVELGAPADQYRTLSSGFNSGLEDPRTAPVQPADRPSTPIYLQAGGLRGNGTAIEFETIEKKDKGRAGETVRIWSPWSNFDIRVLGKIMDANGSITEYSVEIMRERDGATIEAVLPVHVLAKPNELTTWLMKYEVTVFGTNTPPPTWNARFQLYLVAQDAEVSRTAECLGWDDGSESFLTFDGVITPDGLQPFNGVRPDPKLRYQAIDYHYGFADTEDHAIAVLREVLTFHEPEVTSVFGAWWAICLLKGQVMRRVSMFPAMGIEASSESGKTNGFFPMMVSLSGNRRGQANDTTANFRDIVAGHRSGIAWQDDLDDPRKLFEMIRAATSEGTIGKKGEDRSSSVDAKLVAPIMVSGEGIDMSKQKAMADRVISLTATSPKGRRSLRDPSRPQWDDIVAVRELYPDLTVLAGHLVAMALRNVHLLDQLSALRGAQSGRHADKLAVLRVGARLLAEMTGDPSHIDVVDAWCASRIDIGNENTLTLSLVPKFLELAGAQEEPRRYAAAPFHSVPYPVLIRPDKLGDVAVWVNADMLALWWYEHNKGRIEVRTETAEALRGQAHDLGMKGERAGEVGIDYLRLRIYEGAADAANRNEKRTWQRLPSEVGERMLLQFEVVDPSDMENVTPISAGSNGSHPQLDAATVRRVQRATARVGPRT